ncbi:MAG TPA: L-histidine N(alpha)-methyltransferase [Pseudomonadales bacterium]|nr:L-histidine N(alpha)-methyltransferase [Pseudomonadales bacterium]
MSNAQPIYFYDHLPEPEDASAQLIEGLNQSSKAISPKFFYDERGSELFTEITRQPEYYPTRTEIGLLRSIRESLRRLIGDDSVLIEYGSGNSEKIRLLLESLRPRVYAPLDISGDYLARAAEAVASEHPWLEVHATCIDYSREFDLPFDVEGRKVGFFPGSSIGNFTPEEAREFLIQVRSQLGEDGALLIGVDMKKDESVLNRAYNDAAGVTAAFNLNVLTHINREFDANFRVDSFEHLAEYNAEEGCVQMFLVSKQDHVVHIAGEKVRFAAGERIHTENSHKYSEAEFLAMAREAGFDDSEVWQDDNGWFSVFYLHCGD